MALKRVWIPSPNYSSRGGSSVRIIVLHTAEGARTIESLGSFFQGPVGVSSHVGADDKANTVGEYVHRPNKAWTCAEFNPAAVQIELCAFAAWSTDEWNRHPNMLDNCAKWIREEADYYGIPIRALTSSEAQGSGKGVCQHRDLGSRGGGHHDCGNGFPISKVLEMANSGSSATTPTEQGNDMITSAVAANGTLHVFWLGTDRKTVWYRYQKKNQTNWIDGGTLTKSNEKLAGLSSTTTATGTLELFGRQDDGGVVHLWQKANETSWSGGKAGQQKAAFTNLPK